MCGSKCTAKFASSIVKRAPRKTLTKKCKSCGIEYHVPESYERSFSKNGKNPRAFCSKRCAWDSKKILVKPDSRKCSLCGDTKPFNSEFFGSRKQNKFGLDTYCRICTNKKANKENWKYRQKLRNEIISAYSKNRNCCACCGELRDEFLTLDHVNGDGKNHRKKHPGQGVYYDLRRRGFPDGYQILCFNCNCSIGIKGYCPHEKERAAIAKYS